MADQTHAFMRIRPAAQADQPAIRRIVHQAHLDPSRLDWPNFIVAEIDGKIVGIGQVRPYPGCPELGSIVTLPRWRSQGIASRIIERLIADHPGTLYLECQYRMASFYTRFGFKEIRWQDAPMPLRMKAGMGTIIGGLFGFKGAVMKREDNTAG